MGNVTLDDKTFRPYIPYSRIDEAIAKVAGKLNEDYRDCGEVPVLLCVLNGAMVFFTDLITRLDFNMEVVSVKLTSYVGTQSAGTVRKSMDFTGNVKGRKVLVVEDIVDTGNTIAEISRLLKEAGAKETRICTMLFKPAVFKGSVPPDYVGLSIPNDFVVGFGLDYNELGRNLKDIYVVDSQ